MTPLQFPCNVSQLCLSSLLLRLLVTILHSEDSQRCGGTVWEVWENLPPPLFTPGSTSLMRPPAIVWRLTLKEVLSLAPLLWWGPWSKKLPDCKNTGISEIFPLIIPTSTPRKLKGYLSSTLNITCAESFTSAPEYFCVCSTSSAKQTSSLTGMDWKWSLKISLRVAASGSGT